VFSIRGEDLAGGTALKFPSYFVSSNHEQAIPSMVASTAATVSLNDATSALTHLIEAQDSILLVIDIQDYFLNRIDAAIVERVVTRVRWLVQVASWLQVPVVGTAEDAEKRGLTTERIRSVFPPGAPDLNKMVFGLAGQPEILQAVQSCERKTAILVGLETDVCVQHSAFGLARLGYKVAVIADATASPDTGHLFGLERMRAAGVAVLSCKGLFYEWMRDLKNVHHFFAASGIATPPDLLL
jgi:nicotinamidase-related amidase